MQFPRYPFDVTTLRQIAAEMGTPTYVYHQARLLENLRTLQDAFADFDAHIHYSVKANANLHLLRVLTRAGVGMDVVSGGEIFKALKAGCDPDKIVFAGVGKTPAEIRYALEQGVTWFNVENEAELTLIDQSAAALGLDQVRVALRLNPAVSAATHPAIATGHSAAKFGLVAERIASLLAQQNAYPRLTFVGLHVHIGSQLQETQATVRAVEAALELMAPYPALRTLNIGGGIPARYDASSQGPTAHDFAQALKPALRDRRVLLEPGRSLVADAGVLLTRVLYEKHQGGARWLIVDASMTELIRPALYQAEHPMVPLWSGGDDATITQVVGPVCESTDVLAHDVALPTLSAQTDEHLLAIMMAGAYGMVMASQYNGRPRPAEVLIREGSNWEVARRRETWDDLVRGEL